MISFIQKLTLGRVPSFCSKMWGEGLTKLYQTLSHFSQFIFSSKVGESCCLTIDIIDYDIRLVNFDEALSCLSNTAHSFLVRQKDKISIFMENLFPWQKQDEKNNV